MLLRRQRAGRSHLCAAVHPPFPMNPSTSFHFSGAEIENLPHVRTSTATAGLYSLMLFCRPAAIAGRFLLCTAVRAPFPMNPSTSFHFSDTEIVNLSHVRASTATAGLSPYAVLPSRRQRAERSPLCTAVRTSYDLQIRNSSYTCKSLPPIPSHGFIPTVPVCRGKINSCTGLPNSSVSFPSTNPSRL